MSVNAPATRLTMPRVSVIVPNYNHAAFLVERLDSVLAQSFQDTEVLVLDDASTDSSREVIARYVGDRVSFHPSETNSGSPFRQWNRGLAMARGDYVWIAESDDVAEPDLVTSLVDLMDRNPAASLAASNSVIIQDSVLTGERTSDWNARLQEGRWSADFLNEGSAEVAEFLIRENTFPNASAVLFRRSAALAVGGAPEDVRLVGDWLFWSRLLGRGGVAYTGRCLNRFRRHRASVTAGAVRAGRACVERLIAARRIAEEHSLGGAARRRAAIYHAGVCFWEQRSSQPRFSSGVAAEIRREGMRLHPVFPFARLCLWTGLLRSAAARRLAGRR